MNPLFVLVHVVFLMCGLQTVVRRRDLRHVQMSGHFKASTGDMTRALDYYAKVLHADVISMTEVSPVKFRGPLMRWAIENGFHVHHPTGPGRNECAVLSRYPFAKTRAWRLSNLLIRRGSKVPLFLIAAKIKHGPWVGVVHTPAHNGGLNPTGSTAAATRLYLSMLLGLRTVRMRLVGHGVIFSADWNEDLARATMRTQLAKPFPGFSWGWTADQKPTLGNRVVDGILTNMQIVAHSMTLKHFPKYDHAAVFTVVRNRRWLTAA